MRNINQIIFTIRDLKNEFAEAIEKGIGLTGKAKEMNEKRRNQIINEILRLESLANEFANSKKRLAVDVREIECSFDIVEEDKPLRQDDIVKGFKKTMKNIFNKYANSSNKELSERQRETILAGFRDRIGIDVDQVVMRFVNTFNFDQASELIKVLRGISFHNQRVLVTNAVKTLQHTENYQDILAEVCKFIHKKEWFDNNKELFVLANELQAPTEPQIKRIANVAKYPETAEALKEFGIDVRDYEYRKMIDGQQSLYYSMNWEKLKIDIETKMNRETASNFIQTYDYISNFYEGRNLESHQRNHLRQLYIQIADFERTRPSYLNTILKEQFEIISIKLEEAVRMEKIVKNTSKSRLKEAMMNDKTRTKREAREVRSVVLRTEQEEAREFTSFIFNIYAVVGQEVPDEARNILPYFIQGGEAKYAGVEEVHYKQLRKLVFEQRDVIKDIYGQYNSNESTNNFNWGAYLFNQPTHILKALGLDMMI